MLHSSKGRFLVAAAALASFAVVTACSGAVAIGESGPDAGSSASTIDGGGLDAGSSVINDAATSPMDGGAVGLDGSKTCPCSGTDICVARFTSGGPLVQPDDAGVCPPGRHLEGAGSFLVCSLDWTYECGPRPTSCGSSIDCDCASTYCADHYGQGTSCSTQSQSIGVLECIQYIP